MNHTKTLIFYQQNFTNLSYLQSTVVTSKPHKQGTHKHTQTFHYIPLHEYEKYYLDFGNRYLHLTLLSNRTVYGLKYPPMMRNGNEQIDEQMVGRTS